MPIRFATLLAPGTITLSHDTVQRVYFETAQSLIHHGFRRILFLNSAIVPLLPRDATRSSQFGQHGGVFETSAALMFDQGADPGATLRLVACSNA